MELLVARQNVVLEAHAKLVGYVAGLVRADWRYARSMQAELDWHVEDPWGAQRLDEMLQEQAMTLAGFDVYVEALKATRMEKD